MIWVGIVPKLTPDVLKKMTDEELSAAQENVEERIKNHKRGVVPPHLAKNTTDALTAEKDAIEAEISSRPSFAAKCH